MNSARQSYRTEVLRKLVHLSSLWMIWAMLILKAGVTVWLLAFAFMLMLYYERIRYKHYYAKDDKHTINLPVIYVINALIKKIGDPLLRPKEIYRRQWTGATCLTSAAFFAFCLFPKEVVIVALLMTIVGDSVAALIGKRFGRPGINGKSYAGSAAFAIASWLVVLPVCMYMQQDIYFTMLAMLTVLPATLVERLSFDDNYSITFTASILMWLGLQIENWVLQIVF